MEHREAVALIRARKNTMWRKWFHESDPRIPACCTAGASLISAE
jgi:hypothetical protein